MTARSAAGVLAAATAAAVAGVLAGDARIVRDERLTITRPADHARVRGPFTVAWSARELPAGTAFAVFLDQPPMRPGQSLAALGRRDPQCRRLPDCPDRRWLRANGVHVTRRSSVRLPTPSQTDGRRAEGGRRHEVTVVLVDERGVRAGEGSWRRVVVRPEAAR